MDESRSFSFINMTYMFILSYVIIFYNMFSVLQYILTFPMFYPSEKTVFFSGSGILFIYTLLDALPSTV